MAAQSLNSCSVSDLFDDLSVSAASSAHHLTFSAGGEKLSRTGCGIGGDATHRAVAARSVAWSGLVLPSWGPRRRAPLTRSAGVVGEARCGAPAQRAGPGPRCRNADQGRHAARVLCQSVARCGAAPQPPSRHAVVATASLRAASSRPTGTTPKRSSAPGGASNAEELIAGTSPSIRFAQSGSRTMPPLHTLRQGSPPLRSGKGSRAKCG